MESARRKLSANPCETASFRSKLFHTWIVAIFLKGYKRALLMDDMYQPLNCDRSANLGDRLEKTWLECRTKSKSCLLILAVLKTFWREYIVLGVVFGLQSICLRLGQAILLGQLLQYFRVNSGNYRLMAVSAVENSSVTYLDALLYANGIVILNATNAILINQTIMRGFHNGMKVRVAVCSIIYRKALRLSCTALGNTGPGKVVNLLSNDVSRFEYLSISWNALWASPLLLLILGTLLWNEIGWAGIIGIAIVLFVVLIQSYTAKLLSRFRSKMALRSDERVRFMDEIISGVQAIKMYAWERPFARLIARTRKMEMKQVRQYNFVRGMHMAFMMFTPRATVLCTLLSITLLYGSDQITAARVFKVSSFYMALSYMMSEKLVDGVAEVCESLVAFRRLQNFLELDEKEQTPVDRISSSPSALTAQVLVSLRDITARWALPKTTISPVNKSSASTACDVQHAVKEHTSAVLGGLSADFSRGKLIGIIGPVGAGKSSLLQVILRELPIESGSIHINGTISYASQEPWIFAGTVRQNIVFDQEYQKERYDTVVKACALAADFEQLPQRDKTAVGERGISLSGGQKARINLARAIYRRSDIYLLDDPLSAVDAHVGAHIFSKCIGPMGQLARQNATRILVTHQVHYLEAADWVIVLQDNKIAAQGTPAELIRSGFDFVATRVEDDTEKRNEHVSRRSTLRSLSANSTGTTLDEPIHSDTDDGSPHQFAPQFEESSKGKANGSVPLNYFKSGGHWSIPPLLFLSFLVTQFVASAADIWISVWVKSEEQRHSSNQSKVGLIDDSKSESSTFWRYISASEEPPTEFFVKISGILVITLFIIAVSRSLCFLSFCVRASQRLHDGMFKGVISTKMRFFEINPSGRVLNRFAKDIGVIDALLPKMMLEATQIILSLIGVVFVVAYVNPVFLMPILLMAFHFIFVRRAFLKTSKSLKYLEANAKSPVFTHLAATLNGLSTIRAYNAAAILTDEFEYHHDAHTSCWYMFIMANAAFAMALDIMVITFMACVIYYFMVFDDTAPGNKVGLAITQILSLTGLLQWGVRQSAEVSNNMTAVERILEYRDLEPEPEPEKPDNVEKDWPANGRIEFRNISYRYSADAEPVLRDLSFVIKPKEKIGIVGRTGAGKSSLIGAIFRLACIEGELVIDGVDTSSISLKRLRSSIAIIPQDPVLFSGTLRTNLDPFEEYNDADIWSAVEKVELKEIATGQLGLNSLVLAHGSNFSVGQRQLICLARAILRKNGILVLDEATANVDPNTDLVIQKTIRDKFADCTVLTIAHRLHTIIDSDRILVMDAGRAIEFDKAHVLLQNDASIFSGMVTALGPLEHRRLVQIARETHNARNGVQYYHTHL